MVEERDQLIDECIRYLGNKQKKHFDKIFAQILRQVDQAKDLYNSQGFLVTTQGKS